MLDERVRGLTRRRVRGGALLALACALGCGAGSFDESDPVAAAHAFVSDARVRRAAMEASVDAADTDYATIRRAHYALDGSDAPDPANDWDALPVFSPRVRRLIVDGSSASLDEGPVIDGAPADLAGWVAAGARAFERYPAQIDLALSPIRDRATAERMGLSVSSDGIVRGAVEVETSTGWNVALSCAGCHGAERDGTFVLGLPNERLDLGSLVGRLAWPVGTMDVTDDGVDAALRPADLRPLVSQARMQHTGNLFNGRIARMVRIESLAITQLGQHARPSREVIASIALFLESLDPLLPRPDPRAPEAALFQRACAGCHEGASMAGGIVDVAIVGTDGTATLGGQRATGGYRAPSLLGVGDRRGVFHDGSGASLAGVLGLAPSDHVGHAFGRELSLDDREALARWLAP